MRKNCEDAVRRWQRGQESPRSAQGGSIWTDGHALWSYGTALVAVQQSGELVLNGTRYSTTTSIHQNALRAHLRPEREVQGAPKGAYPAVLVDLAKLAEQVAE